MAPNFLPDVLKLNVFDLFIHRKIFKSKSDCAFIFFFSCLLGSVPLLKAQERNAPSNSSANAHGPQEGVFGKASAQQQPSAEVTPSINQINCQEPVTNEEEEIERQEQAARDLEKAVVGLEIAQGAIEITLGAIRIAASGTTAEVLRREDAIAQSRASASAALGTEGTVTPLEPIARKDAPMNDENTNRKVACARAHRRNDVVPAHDPYSAWSNGFLNRMKRSPLYGQFFSEESHNFVKPTPSPNAVDAYPVKLPNTEEAEHLLNLLENLLNTNNEVLRLLGIDLPPLTNQPANPGAMILRQYKQRLARQKDLERRYAQTGYLEENTISDQSDQDASWRTSGQRTDVHALTSELAQLNRLRQRLSVKRR